MKVFKQSVLSFFQLLRNTLFHHSWRFISKVYFNFHEIFILSDIIYLRSKKQIDKITDKIEDASTILLYLTETPDRFGLFVLNVSAIFLIYRARVEFSQGFHRLTFHKKNVKFSTKNWDGRKLVCIYRDVTRIESIDVSDSRHIHMYVWVQPFCK